MIAISSHKGSPPSPFSPYSFFYIPLLSNLPAYLLTTLNIQVIDHGRSCSRSSFKDEEEPYLLSENHWDILELFESVINSSPEPNVEQKTQLLVDGLIKLAPGKEGPYEAFHSSTWYVFNRISGCIPYRHYGQNVLIETVPGCPYAGDSEFTNEEWLNFNSYLAKLYSDLDIKFLAMFAVCQMREDIEGDPNEED